MLKTQGRKIAEKQVKAGGCQWFLLCKNKAVKTRDHVILGAVPICKRCDDKIEFLSR